MTPSTPRPDGAHEPLDASDLALLDAARAGYQQTDPVQVGLVDRIQFAMALESIDIEVLHLREEVGLASTRGEERSRTITFDSDSLTIMIQLSLSGVGAVRIDGWLAPPAAHQIEVRTASGVIAIQADESGRFVIEPVPRGMAQLVVITEPGGAGRKVVTPSIVV